LLSLHRPKEASFLAQDETVLPGKLQIGGAIFVTAQPGSVRFIVSETAKRYQRQSYIVRALMRHEG
jgi:hypothetical protein